MSIAPGPPDRFEQRVCCDLLRGEQDVRTINIKLITLKSCPQGTFASSARLLKSTVKARLL
jgi:hypothetical protein